MTRGLRRTVARWLFGVLTRRVANRRPADFHIGPSPLDPYMRRWFIIPRNRWFNIYLHHIRHSDDDRALHDHPWWSVSLCLNGVMAETTGHTDFDHPGHRMRIVEVGDVVIRPPHFTHRLEIVPELLAPSCWTLFITGPKVRTWGFHCPQGFVPWDEFVDPDNPGAPGRGCGETDALASASAPMTNGARRASARTRVAAGAISPGRGVSDPS